MEGNNTLLVRTEALMAGSNAVKNKLDDINKVFDRIDEHNNKLLPKWEGEGAEAYKRVYAQVREHVEQINKRLNEHVRDLYEMAGIYEEAEGRNEEEADALPSDVLV